MSARTKASAAILALAGMASSASMSSALAADIAVAPSRAAPAFIPVAYNWSGFYIGGNAGGHWGRDRVTSSTDAIGWGAGGAAEIDAASPVNLQPQGFIGGVQAGFNLQMGSNFVAGIEGDANWLTGTKSRTLVFPGSINVAGGDFMTNSTNAIFLGTARGRLGLTSDRSMLYATGGLAVGTLKTNDSFGSFSGTVVTAANNTTHHAGWTAGGGGEFAFTDNWSAKVEYLYVDLPTFDALIPSCGICATGSDIVVHHRFTDHIVRFGLNYRFGGPVTARY